MAAATSKEKKQPKPKLKLKQPDPLNRMESLGEWGFDSESLVGSFFLSTYERGWQGCIVARPSPDIYLIELFDWIIGASTEQRLVHLHDLLDWSFYDTAQWMRNAYEHGTADRWERQRKEAEQAGPGER